MKRALFLSFLITALWTVLSPVILRVKSTPPYYRAINSARTLGISLSCFEDWYGHFPQAEIPINIESTYPHQDRSDSNYILGQLLADKLSDTEKDFTIHGRGIAADDFSSPDKILEAGECQFSYISGAGSTKLNSQDFHPSTPVLLAPMINGTMLFDPNFYGHGSYSRYNYAVIGRLDGSVSRAKIPESGIVLSNKRREGGLFETGPNTVWKNQEPIIHHPLPYEGAPALTTPKESAPFFYRKSTGLVFGAISFALILGSTHLKTAS